MCGRYTLTSPQGLIEDLGVATAEPAEASEWWRPRFNIAPTQPAPVVLVRDGVRVLEMMRWGLVPAWADSLAGGARMINARADTLASKPAFRDAVKKRRCIVPADGFFEWTTRGTGRSTKKIPIYLRPVPRRLVGFAGLWERWKNPDGIWVLSFTIITGPPNSLIEPLHDRMPVILAPDDYATWLGADVLPPPVLDAVLAVPPVADWQASEVSTLASSVANDEPACIDPIAPFEPPARSEKAKPEPEPPRQGRLFE